MNRILRRAALVVPALLLLSGCVRLNADITLHPDDTMDVAMDIGIQQAAASAIGITDMCASMTESAGSGTSIPNATFTPHTDNGYISCKIEGTVPINESMDGLTITHADGVFTFAMKGASLESSTSQYGDLGTILTDLKISVTFPGDVLTHNGKSTVSGRTVTWSDVNDFIGTEGLLATGKDSAGIAGIGGGGGGSRLGLILGIIGVLLVAGIVVAVVLSRRGKKPPTGAWPSQPGYPAQPAYYPVAQPEYPAAQPGYPAAQPGYGQPPTGYQQPGYPAQPGYQPAPPTYQAPPGYPQQPYQ